MLFSESVMSKFVYYIKVKEIDFFNSALNRAKEITREFSDIDKMEIKKRTPVIFGSECKSFDGTRLSLSQNDDCKRRYLIFDGDFDDAETSAISRQKLIDFAEKNEYALIIYPTISAPEKPRWRSILFTKNLLTLKNQIAGAKYLIEDVMGIPEDQVDKHNYDKFHNFNLPVFISEDQFDLIYNNTDKYSGFVDTKLFKEKAKNIKIIKNVKEKTEFIKFMEPNEFFPYLTGELDFAMSHQSFKDSLKDNKTFYKYIASVIYDVKAGNLNLVDAYAISDRFASVAPDKFTEKKWKSGNREKILKESKSKDFNFNQSLFTILSKYRKEFG